MAVNKRPAPSTAQLSSVSKFNPMGGTMKKYSKPQQMQSIEYFAFSELHVKSLSLQCESEKNPNDSIV